MSSNSQFVIYKVNTTNGDIDSVYEINSFGIGSGSNIGITPSNNALFVNTISLPSNTSDGLILVR